METDYRTEAVATLGVSKKHCYACANILDARAELCPRCGVRQPSLAPPPPPPSAYPMPVVIQQPVPFTTKSKGTAAVLAFFLGGIGIHKFYLGQTGAGIVYLLFFWTFVPAIIAFIEFFVLIGMSEVEFARKFPG